MNKHIFALFRGAVLLLGFALLTGCAQAPAEVSSVSGQPSALLTNESAIVYNVTPEYVFTYAENQTEDYPTTQGAYRFAQLVNERTQGRIQIRVYANAQLGDETSTLEQLRFGGLDFARCSLSTMTAYSEMSNALMPRSWYDAGVRNFYFTKPVSTLDEMQGLVIRVQPVEMMEDMIRLLGASALPVSYENVYSAIQRGEADGAENNWSSYDAMHHNEVAPYYLLDEHMRVPESQIVSAVTWDLLSVEDRQIIKECSALSADYERMLWSAREDEARARVMESGCTEITLSEDEKKKFRDAMEPLYKKYCGDYMDLVDQIRQTGAPDPQ